MVAALKQELSPAKPSSSRKQRPRSLSLRWMWNLLLTIVILTVIGVALGALVIGLAIRKYESGLPSAEQLRNSYRPPQVTRVLARDGTVLSQVFTERRSVVSFEAIPAHTKLCFLAAEDAHFYEHEGLNYLGMLRAIAKNLRAGRTVQGGSTITQQVVKNLWLSHDRTMARKIQETILATRLEQSLSKNEILALYLNHIYLGHGRYGVEEAARYYFGILPARGDRAQRHACRATRGENSRRNRRASRSDSRDHVPAARPVADAFAGRHSRCIRRASPACCRKPHRPRVLKLWRGSRFRASTCPHSRAR